MAYKISMATAWLQGCAGCHMSFLDLHGELAELLDVVDIKYSPLLDAKDIPEVDLCLVEGAVANEENEAVLKTLRERSETLVALGTCACTGGITGFRNVTTLEDAMKCSYIDNPTTVDGQIPSGSTLPELKPVVKALHQVVPVDCSLRGCPPSPAMIREVIFGIVKGSQTVDGTRNLCHGCPRIKDKMLVSSRDFLIDEVVSVHEVETIDPELCFLEQGVLCMGPATQEGCGAICPKANVPCRGCQGPPQGAPEQGAKLINCLSSLLPAGGVMFHEDIEGMGYCFCMPVSIFPHLEKEKGEGGRG